MSNKITKVEVRLTPKEKEKLTLQAKEKGFLNTSAYLRYLYKNDKTTIDKRKLTKDYVSSINFNLSKIGTNLNQVSKALNNKLFIDFDNRKLDSVISDLKLFLSEFKK